MGLRVGTQDLGYPDLHGQIEDELQKVFKNRGGDWEVIILGAQDNTKWEMTVKDPNGYKTRYTLYGENGGHNPKYLAALLNADLNPAAREVNRVVAERVREEADYNLDGFTGGFLVIDGVNVKTADAIAMRQAGKLTRKGISEYANQTKT